MANRLVPANLVRKAGPYVLGPRLGSCPVKSIVQCLAKREDTVDKFFHIKMLVMSWKDGEIFFLVSLTVFAPWLFSLKFTFDLLRSQMQENLFLLLLFFSFRA